METEEKYEHCELGCGRLVPETKESGECVMCERAKELIRGGTPTWQALPEPY